MKTTDNTILITGGGSGIGLETAKLLSAAGNDVIIVGRDRQKLREAASMTDNLHYYQCDVTNEPEVNSLVANVKRDFPTLNILINNAGKAHYYSMKAGAGASEKALEEMMTNYIATIRLTEKLLPVMLEGEQEGAIVNVSSVLAFAPSVMLPTYSASKAALHSYTQALRLALAPVSRMRVMEVMPPLVNTEFSKGIPGERIEPVTVASAIVNGLAADEPEIHIGATASLYKLFLNSPFKALNVLNGLSA